MDTLLYVKLTQDEMHDPINIEPITHFLLYNQTQKIIVDITSDVEQAPLLFAVPKMKLIVDETFIRRIERVMSGVKEPEKGMDVRPITYIKKLEYEELIGEQYEPVANAMVQLRDRKSSLDDVVVSLQGHLISVGIVTVTPEPVSVSQQRVFIMPVDPSTLDSETKQRLEDIVEGVEDPNFKAEFYLKLRNGAKSTKYSEAILREDSGRNVHYTAESLMHKLEKAERLGISEEERKNLAQQVYELALKERKYDLGLQMAKILQLPEETVATIREKKLYDVMTANWATEFNYIDAVKEDSSEIPLGTIMSITKQAYEELMTNKQNYFGGSNYLHAGQLAKEYGLGRDKMLEAGRKFIEVHLSANYVGEYKAVEKAFTDFGLPEEMVHPLMLRFFEQSLHWNSDQSKKIAERHPFSDKEIGGAVNQAYTRFKQNGNFDAAIRLRQLHTTIIQDQLPIEDLRTIAGVMHYQQ